MIRKNLLKFISAVFILGIFTSCSKLDESIPSALDIKTHKVGILDPGSTDFHGNLARESNWDLTLCQSCHDANYTGGITGVSCLTCHTQETGPEACNTCHGDFEDPNIIAPPEDTNKNISSTFIGVGAHVTHLMNNDLGSQIECTTCHKVPQNYFDAEHTDSPLPAEIIFNNLAINNLGVNAFYDHPSATCSEVYCHGNFEFLKDSAGLNAWIYTDSLIVGNIFSPIWNQVDGTQALCGTCHMLPPQGHQNEGNDPNAISCGGCHIGIVDTDGNIIDTDRHINGKKNVFGN